MQAELVFEKAPIDVAVAPIGGPADVCAMAACSVIYDRAELARRNGGWIGVRVAEYLFQQTGMVPS